MKHHITEHKYFHYNPLTFPKNENVQGIVNRTSFILGPVPQALLMTAAVQNVDPLHTETRFVRM
jgi:hypothetical protein